MSESGINELLEMLMLFKGRFFFYIDIFRCCHVILLFKYNEEWYILQSYEDEYYTKIEKIDNIFQFIKDLFQTEFNDDKELYKKLFHIDYDFERIVGPAGFELKIYGN